MTGSPGTLLTGLKDRLRSLSESADLPLGRWWEYVELVAARRALGHDGPLLTALIGPTGAGKSTLLNLALGQSVSRAGAIRPTTSRPLAVTSSENRTAIESDPFLDSGELDLDVRVLDDVAWLERIVIIDTPDFDSIEELHRRRSWRLLLRADRVVLVLNPEKYGDAAVERTIAELVALGNVGACLFNKYDTSAPFEDCRERLTSVGLPTPLAIPRIDDPDTGTGLDADLRREIVARIAPARIPDGWFERRLAGAERLEREVREQQIAPWVTGASNAIDSSRAGIAKLVADLPARVSARLPLQLDDALKRELLAKFSAQVRRFDPLREPRRWLRETVGRWFGAASDDRTDSTPSTALWLTEAYGDRYLDLRYGLRDDVAAILSDATEPATPTLALPQAPEVAREASTQDLERVFDRLCEEIRKECDRIAEGLSTGSKITFFGSQAAVHTLMLLLFVKTGGLSPTELIAQGLLSPALAGLAEKLVSSGELAAVEERLSGVFTSDIVEELERGMEPLLAQLAELRERVPSQEEWREAVSRWQEGS